MVIIPWDGFRFHEKSNTVKGNGFNETDYYNRGTFSQGILSPCVRMQNNEAVSHLLTNNELAHVHNKCVDKIINQGQVVENYFETIYERREALELAATAARKLLHFITNFKKPQYWKSFGKPKPKDLPEAWITYNFGVAPLVATIDSAMHLLSKPYPTIVLRGASGMPVVKQWKVDDTWETTWNNVRGTYFKEIRAYVVPKSNPNAALANVVGLSTPFSTAFSVIPWGWAVDYFVNCSQLISNFEDRFPGIRFASVWESVSLKVEFNSARYSRWYKKYVGTNYGTAHNTFRQGSSLQYKLEFSFPLLGGSQFANLASAIALTLKGTKK